LPSLLALFLLRGTPESRSASAQQHKLDVSGLLSLILALVLVNLFISKGHGWGWTSAVAGDAGRGAGIGAVFIRSGQRKGDAALIDFALFRNRAYSAGGAVELSAQRRDWHHDDRQHLAAAGASPDAAGERNDDLGYLVTVLAMIRVARSCCSAMAPGCR
jgi:DHA2 family multidrug resistance protein-like MFS transporter